MNITITKPQEFPSVSASLVSQKIINLQKSQSIVNIILATGNTMVDFLDCLSKQSGIDWSRLHAYHLDEYKNLAPTHPSSFAFFLNKHLFSKAPIPQKNIHYINGKNPKLTDYMAKIKKSGGAHIVMLGVGLDGHLAFNEPPTYSNFDGRIGEVKLNQITIDANKSDYPEIVNNPYAYSMGMADIFEGHHLFFLANKKAKADIVAKSLQGPVTPIIPASILQKHPQVTVVLDKDSASLLSI